MSIVFEQRENYHHGNDLPDTSTLTSVLTLERSAGGRAAEDVPVSQTPSTAGAKNTC